MLNWIRGWGADVTVIAPAKLKYTLQVEAERMAKIYKVATNALTKQERLLRLWGKTTNHVNNYHPALYHIIDVATVAQELLNPANVVSPRWRQVLAMALNANPDSLHQWLPFIIALHDIGKITAPFQAQNKEQKERLDELGFDFGGYIRDLHNAGNLHHTIMGQIVLDLEGMPIELSRMWKKILFGMIGGHHGRYNLKIKPAKRKWRGVAEPPEWQAFRKLAIRILEGYFLRTSSLPEPTNVSAGIATLNGFTIVCDWLGSDDTIFCPAPEKNLAEYVVESRKRAKQVIEKANFHQGVRGNAGTSFQALFNFTDIRPLQALVDQIPDTILQKPTITIAETLTGEGKTEFSWGVAHRIAHHTGTNELYVALPTMATSNAMFPRLQEHLRDNLNLSPQLTKLIHGQDFLIEDDLRITTLDNGGDEENPISLDWFDSKKQALLAPFGVGTIDQAMLCALLTKHNALRLIGLAGKVVILDEIHAYDAYMLTIIEQLLRWLSAVGSSVILLSATLPLQKRQQLLKAYVGREVTLDAEKYAAYPAVIVANQDTHCHYLPPPHQPDPKIITWQPIQKTEAEAAEWLLAQVANGGCACWIANTVKRAQDIFSALQCLEHDGVRIDLLHGRLPLEDRQAIEDRVVNELYGPKIKRQPHKKGIIVSTQVLEQSIDIDMDVMASDLAPVDLLLQRAGRLHRHKRKGQRPTRHKEPRLYIHVCLHEDNSLRMGDDIFYTEFLLRQTWRVLQTHEGTLTLPQDYRTLIEAVYVADNHEPDLMDVWQKLEQERAQPKGLC